MVIKIKKAVRLIDAKVLVELIKNYAKEAIDANQKTLDPVDDTLALIDIIDNMPDYQIPAWISAAEQTPAEDELVLVIASGQPQKNITLIDSYQLACYTAADGWIVESYPQWDNAKISYWQALTDFKQFI